MTFGPPLYGCPLGEACDAGARNLRDAAPPDGRARASEDCPTPANIGEWGVG